MDESDVAYTRKPAPALIIVGKLSLGLFDDAVYFAKYQLLDTTQPLTRGVLRPLPSSSIHIFAVRF